MNLPSRAGAVEDLVEVRIPIPDRPGAAAEVFSLSGELGVNVVDFEVVHSVEGDRGVMVLVVRSEHVDIFRGGLLARGFRPAVQQLT
jgi:prephenate dehydrogenase